MMNYILFSVVLKSEQLELYRLAKGSKWVEKDDNYDIATFQPSFADKLTFINLKVTWCRRVGSVKRLDYGLLRGGEEGTGSERAGQASALHLAAATVRVLLMEAMRGRAAASAR